MSGKKMGIWIAFISFLSLVHSVKIIILANEIDVGVRGGIGLTLVLFTALFYGKAYVALRKQEKSLTGKKFYFFTRATKTFQRAQHDRVQSVDERAENQNLRDGNQYERQYLDKDSEKRAQDLYERAEIEIDRAKNRNQSSQSKNELVECQKTQVINNAKEQKFLNTIIIIACIAVITLAPAVIYSFLAASTEINVVILGVTGAMYCLNFAANPFVYCLRLRRYRETFKIVYCCKG